MVFVYLRETTLLYVNTGKICPENVLRKSSGHLRMVLNATMKVKSILLNN